MLVANQIVAFKLFMEGKLFDMVFGVVVSCLSWFFFIFSAQDTHLTRSR